MSEVTTRRLAPGDREVARQLFALMAFVFEEDREPLSDAYVDRLLARESFWAYAAITGGGEIVGGVTGHTLPMSRAESDEVFLYDLAVHPVHQRKGIGRRLVMALREGAAEAGIEIVFVAAENEDEHALEFYHAVGGEAQAVTVFSFPPPGVGQGSPRT